MKMLKKLLFTGLAFAALNVTAQTAADIAAKNVEAMGGAAKLATLNTAVMTGTMTSQGTDFPITFTKTHLKGMRIEFEIMGSSNYQLANAEKGFAFMPIMQMTEPKEMEADQFKSFLTQQDLQGAFLNFKEKGTTLELLGNEKLDGADVVKIKATYKIGKITTYYLDAKTSRVVKSVSMAKAPDGSDREVESSFSNYKQNADGFWFPYNMVTTNGPIAFEKIETNTKVEESIYKP